MPSSKPIHAPSVDNPGREPRPLMSKPVPDTNVSARLERWFTSCCDGDWEHAGGVQIESLDNPGWSLKVDLHGTPLEHRDFAEIHEEQNDRNWVVCRVRDGRFEG